MEPALCIICGKLSNEMASLWYFAGITKSMLCICSDCWEKDPVGCQAKQNQILDNAFKDPDKIVAEAARCHSCAYFCSAGQTGVCKYFIGRLETKIPIWMCLTNPMYADEGCGCLAWKLKEGT